MTDVANIWDGIENTKLISGKGDGSDGDCCAIQEYRRRVGLDPRLDDCPPDVCPALHRFVIGINDAREEWRAKLPPLLPRLQGSRGSWPLTVRRAFRAADWSVREAAPRALDSAAALLDARWPTHAAGLREHAGKLRALGPVAKESAAAAAAARAARADAAAAAAAAADAAAAAYAAAAAARAARAAARAADDAAAAAAAARAADDAADAAAAARAADDAADAAAAARAADDAADAAVYGAAQIIDPIALLVELIEMTEAP